MQAGGTPNPLSQFGSVAGGVYRLAKFVPYLSLAIDAGETAYSCYHAYSSR
jgi:hypothetical protein